MLDLSFIIYCWCHMLDHYHEENFILRVIRGLSSDPREVQTHLKGASWLMHLDGNQFLKPTNVDQLKNFYV